MKYVGSKSRYLKDILPVLKGFRKPDQLYVEPFVGGANVICKMEGRRLGADVNPYLISLFKALQTGWEPPSVVTEETYTAMKLNPSNYPPHLVGFVGFCSSFGTKWFGGFARGKTPKGEPRNYTAEGARGLLKQRFNGVEFIAEDYRYLVLSEPSLIYCDPPYRATTKYKDEIDHDEFFRWCRAKKAEGHTIVLSEYNAPEDFSCVWSKEVCSSLDKDTGSKKAVEKLFVLN